MTRSSKIRRGQRLKHLTRRGCRGSIADPLEGGLGDNDDDIAASGQAPAPASQGLHATDSGRHDQDLAQRRGVLARSRTWLEVH